MKFDDTKILISDDSILARKQLKDILSQFGTPTFLEAANGQDAIDENLNKLLKEKLNCSLKINWIGWAEYANKYPLLFSSGEEFDMAYSASWLNFASLAQKGAFKSLDELWPTYGTEVGGRVQSDVCSTRSGAQNRFADAAQKYFECTDQVDETIGIQRRVRV